MSDHSNIEWTDSTWNVVIGCDKVSPGCDHCYAIRTAHRMQANPNEKIAAAYAGTEADGEWTGKVNLVHDRLDMPLRWRIPRKIFVNAQSDLFHADVPDEFIARVWAVMALAPRHTFQILTKRPGRMRSLLSSAEFESLTWQHVNRLLDGDWLHLRPSHPLEAPVWPLPNVWLGTSVEDQKRANLRIPALLDTPAAVRFLSCEPLLGEVDIFRSSTIDRHPGIDWVIVGGESGKGARPMHPSWARLLRAECVGAGIPFLFKQWGNWAPVAVGDERPTDRWVLGNGFTHDEPWSPEQRGAPTGKWHAFPDVVMRHQHKKDAGRELDGRTWDQYPEVVS